MTRARRQLEPSALELIEEAVHLLRSVSMGTLAIYFAGAVPFALGLLFYAAYAAWFQPSGAELAWGAAGLVGLFGGMKAMQAEFCARLLAARLGAPSPAWSWASFRRNFAAQLRLQPWAFAGVVIASAFVVPLGWFFAYSQNLVIVGDDDHLHEDAAEQAKLWPAQNHLALLMISAVALLVWGNLAAAFYAVPWLANKLFGIENIFGFSGWWFANTTFLASVTVLTWLALDPLVKAFYTLRVFHGRARRTGEDVRVELQRAQREKGRAWPIAALLLIAVILATPRVCAEAATSPKPAPPTVQSAQLDHAIDGVLAGPEFRWRLHPRKVAETKAPDGPIKAFIRHGVEMLGEMLRSVGRTLRKVVDWIALHLRGNRDESDSSAGKAAATALDVIRLLLYVFIAAVVVLIVWVIWLMARRARPSATVLAAQAVTTAAPDLRDENVQAAQLPVDGWLALAREQAALGEWRLALRALYLATLARLAAEGLVSLAKFKTNLDYEREVRRRALSRTDVVGRVAARRREFEDGWDGNANAAEGQVRGWMAEIER